MTLEAIRRDGPLTRLELGSRSGLTGPGITNILRRLGDDGLIKARKRVEGGSGQPSTEFAINADGEYGVGVRLRGESAEAVLIDLCGKVRQNRCFQIEDPAEGIADALRSITADFGRGGRLLGVGVATEDPSVLDLERLQRTLGPTKSFVERDSVTAILAERTFGVNPAEGGLMLIIIDDRVRAGFLFRGAPFGGVRKRAGAIGLMRTGADHVPLDSIVSLKVLLQALTPEERASFARCGTVEITPSVQAWIRNAAGHLVDAIVASAGFLAPGAILLGGDLPANLIEALIVEIAVERGDTAARPFISPWISAIRPASLLRLLQMKPVAWLSDPAMAPWSAVIANIWRGTAFSMVVMDAARKAIDPELYEAAEVDGASPAQRLIHITLPQLRPAIVVNMILITIQTMNTFDVIISLTGGGPGLATEVISLYTFNIVFRNYDLAGGSVMSAFMLGISLTLALAYTAFLPKEEER